MRIPLGRPSIGTEELEEIKKVMDSCWLAHGPRNDEFEKEFAKYIGTEHAVALNSCTSALHMAIEGLGIRGEVLVPSLTFVASANAIMLAGARPVFVDCDRKTYNIDLEDLEKKVGEKTEAIMPVHIAGQGCEMDRIMEIAEKHNLHIIEDSAEACGAEFKGKKLGSFGNGCFSFYPTKNMTTGEGGMLTTNNQELAEKVKAIRGHGIDKSAWAREKSKQQWERIQRFLGYNYRLTDFQAAMGLVQLKRLDQMNRERLEYARFLTKNLSGLEGIEVPFEEENRDHVYQMYIPLVDGIDRDRFVLALRERGIGASVHFNPPVHKQPFYLEKHPGVELPNTDWLCKRMVTLPMYHGMKREELEFIVSGIEETISRLKPSKLGSDNQPCSNHVSRECLKSLRGD